MKKTAIVMMIVLGLSTGANAKSCVDAVENIPVSGLKIQPISVSEVTTINTSACVDEDSVVVSHVSTFKGSPSKVDVSVDVEDENVGVFY